MLTSLTRVTQTHTHKIMKTTFKTVILGTLIALATITSLVSCEEGNVAEVHEDSPATRAARISNMYLSKRMNKYHDYAHSEKIAEENERLLTKAKKYLSASSSAQRALVQELLVRDWEFGGYQRFEDPNKNSQDSIVWAEACINKVCWGPGSYTKEVKEVIYNLIESVLDKELGRTMAAYPAASKLKQQALMADCPVTPGRSTSQTQKIYEALNFDWEAGKELQRLVPGRTYSRHELIIMLAEIPMPRELRAAAILWVDGL